MPEPWLTVLARAASVLDVPLREHELILFDRYYQELITWNKKINLLSRSSLPDTFLKNCIDSLAVVRFLPGRGDSLLDIGSGGGFPGIPLKIALSTLNVSLLDSSRKKTSFLKQVIRVLPLSGVTVIHTGAEHPQANGTYRNAFDVVISKAAFKLPAFLTAGAYYLAPEGALIAMKGVKLDKEMEESEPVATALGLQLSASYAVTLPGIGDCHRLLIFRRTNSIAETE